MKPRVLFVSHTAEWTGPTHSLSLLIRHLRDRFDMAVLMPGHGMFTDLLDEQGIPAFSFGDLRKSKIPRIIRLLRDESFDLVYANNTSSVSKNALIAAKIRGLPTIYHVREMGRRGNWRQGFLRFADAVIAVSEATARSIAPFLRGRRPYVVYNGVTVPAASANGTAARARLREIAEIPASATVLLNVGDVQPRKGQELAIRALQQVVSRTPSTYLTMVGRLDPDTEYVRRILELAGELGIRDRVRMLGFRADVPDLIDGSDVLVHTPNAEPFGRVVLEAMVMGVPVVATAVDGVTEIVADGQTGYLVERGDVSACAAAIVELLDNPERMSEFGRRGRARVLEHFTAEETARQVGEIIQRTLGV